MARRLRSFSGLLMVAVICGGCATPQPPVTELKARSAALARDFSHLSPSVDPAEAQKAADAAISYPFQLAREWHAVRPATYNNLLINSGIHPRGLCYEWADTLTMKLMTLHLRTLELRRGVAHLGTLREHSCVVVNAPGKNFTNGIALDAWRYAGKLHWSPVSTDDYPWKEVNLDSSYWNYLLDGAEKIEKQPQR